MGVFAPSKSILASADTICVSSESISKDQTGVRIHNPQKAYSGYTLFSHNPIGIYGKDIIASPIYLINMDGDVVHKWIVDVPSFHARLLKNGHLMYHTTSATRGATGSMNSVYGLYEINPLSYVTWFHNGRINHDFHLLDSNTILYSKNDERSPLFQIVNRKHVTLWEWKAEEHVEKIAQIIGLQEPINTSTDWAHNNTCQMLTDNPIAKLDPRFKKNNILFCFANLDIIGVVEYPSGEIVWTWGHGIISKPHAPEMLANGNILLFDNGVKNEFSRALELNPLSKEIVWEYRGTPPKSFYSKTISNAQRLPNGNTLICEGNASRLFEVTPDGEIVWDYISTLNRTTGGAGIYRAYRYSENEIRELFKKLK